jgi:hypothetical protein
LVFYFFLASAFPLLAADLNDLTWDASGATVIITDCDEAASGALVIPDTIEGKTVTSIGDSAFLLCRDLVIIDIPASVTNIGHQAFEVCTGLANITLPGVTSIGNFAFGNCTSLTSITLPDSVTSIGSYAFQSCENLFFIVVAPGNLHYVSEAGVLFNIDKSVLIACPAKKSGVYAIPSSVTEIGLHAFSYCINLTSITLPNNVTNIGHGAFYYCNALTSMTVPDSVTSIGNSAFSDCTSLMALRLSSNLTNIGSAAFQYCRELTSISISGTVASIGSHAFSYCARLIRIYMMGDAPTIGGSVFLSNHALAVVHVSPAATGYGGTFGGLPVLRDEAWGQILARIATLELRPTLEEVQDARLGSVVLIKDEASGEINFDFNLEETEDLVNWTPVVSGTWTDPGDGGVEVDLPLAGDKRFYRVVVEFE